MSTSQPEQDQLFFFHYDSLPFLTRQFSNLSIIQEVDMKDTPRCAVDDSTLLDRRRANVELDAPPNLRTQKEFKRLGLKNMYSRPVV